MLERLRGLVGERLEAGVDGVIARALGAAWAGVASRRVARSVALPERVFVIGVGSAVLGGAGKTPLSIALAAALAEAGHDVALIGHAYRARPGLARRVAPDAALDQVGDDALFAARALAPRGVPVLVGATRGEAVAAARAAVVVVDGLLQARPRRVDVSLLVVDGDAPWGSRACPPAGDLRAPREALARAADLLVAVVRPGVEPPAGAIAIRSDVGGAGAYADRRVGLVTAIARPERVLASLAGHGVVPRVVVRLADHAKRGWETVEGRGLDAWLTTARDAMKLPATLGGAPVVPLRHDLDVAGLLEHLRLPA